MERNMKETLKIIKQMDLGNFTMQMETFMKVIGKMIQPMDLENIFIMYLIQYIEWGNL